MSEPILIAAIAALGALIGAMPGTIKAVADSRRQDEESEINAVRILLDPLKTELADERQQTAQLRREVNELRQQMSELQRLFDGERRKRLDTVNGVSKLRHQLQSHGLTPVWSPTPADDIK